VDTWFEGGMMWSGFQIPPCRKWFPLSIWDVTQTVARLGVEPAILSPSTSRAIIVWTEGESTNIPGLDSVHYLIIGLASWFFIIPTGWWHIFQFTI